MMNITIVHRDGSRQINAVRIACHFGIHESLASGHTLTHIPTGLAMRDGITFAQARRTARRLARLPLDWSSTDQSYFGTWARSHPWRVSWAMGQSTKRLRQPWERFKRAVWRRLERPLTRAKNPIADVLDLRDDICWPDLVMWTFHHTSLIDATPWGFWGPQVAKCRRDARVQGSCYCGKFCNQATALDLGWKPGDARPIIVTSELTALDCERTIEIVREP